MNDTRTPNDTKKTGVLFVCLGNICRSPLAEGVFSALAEQRGVRDRFEIDSCGTGGWHVGEGPDPRALDVARRHGVRLDHRARQIDPTTDLTRFDLLIAMDRSNLTALKRMGVPPERARLLREFDPETPGDGRSDMEVPDPYYGGKDGFERVYELVRRSCGGLLDALVEGKAGVR